MCVPGERVRVRGIIEMCFYATFIKLRPKDNRPVPVSLAVQLSARSAGDAVSKLEQLREAGRWPAVANAVRLFKDGYELGLFGPVFGARLSRLSGARRLAA